LSHEVEQLVVEAIRVGLTERDVVTAVKALWAELFGKGQGDGR
jgi:hypothetical protein